MPSGIRALLKVQNRPYQRGDQNRQILVKYWGHFSQDRSWGCLYAWRHVIWVDASKWEWRQSSYCSLGRQKTPQLIEKRVRFLWQKNQKIILWKVHPRNEHKSQISPDDKNNLCQLSWACKHTQPFMCTWYCSSFPAGHEKCQFQKNSLHKNISIQDQNVWEENYLCWGLEKLNRFHN